MTNTIQYDSKTPFLDSKTPFLFSPSLSLSLSPKNPLSVFLLPHFLIKTLNPTSLPKKKKKKKIGDRFLRMGERLFLEEDTKTLHTLHPSVIIIGERIKSIREEIDDDVNDDKERRQKRMRGEEEETAPVRRALFFKTHTHTYIYIDWCWCCVLLFPSMSLG